MREVRPGVVKEALGRMFAKDFQSYMYDVRPYEKHKKVMVSAVLEPLKVRLITKGESTKYYLGRFYQKGLWSYLKEFEQFALTNRPVQDYDLYNILDKEKKVHPEGLNLRWMSGDYSAATDNIKIFYTKMVLEESLKHARYSEETKESLRSVLYEQELNYPEKFSLENQALRPEMQTQGQLMGSILSFPILCILNFCIYWMALERTTGRMFRAKDLPVLVNGDDILFRTEDTLYANWLELIKEVGFELSVGKNYNHKSYLTVNSKGYLFNSDSKQFHEINYLNVGLLVGNSKLQSKRKQISPIWDNYNTVVSGAVDKFRAHCRFMFYNRESINDLTDKGKYSPFIHQAYGGLGFKLFDEVKSHVYFTHFQKKFGSYLRMLSLQEFKGEFMKFKPFRGLVQPVSVKRPMFQEYHYGVYKPIERFTPLNVNESSVLDMDQQLESAKLSTVFGSDNVMTIRPIDKKLFKGFDQWMPMEFRINKLLDFPYKYIEINELLGH